MKNKEDFIKKIKAEKNNTNVKRSFNTKYFNITNFIPAPDKKSLLKVIKYSVTIILSLLLFSLLSGLLFFKSFTDLYDSNSVNKIKTLTNELSKVEIINKTDYNNSLVTTNFILSNQHTIFLIGIIISIILFLIIVLLLGKKRKK